MVDEIKIAAVKVTSSGVTAGDMYFGTGVAGQIGWASANGSSFNTNWTILPGETNLLRGALYVDQTGVFTNDLIAVTGGKAGEDPGNGVLVGGAVWLVSQTNAVKLAQINEDNGNSLLLEGVLTVPDDPLKYGPWAGKLLAGSEFGGQPGRIYAIDPRGTVTIYDLGICDIEDIDLIPSGQHLYALDFHLNDETHSTLFKVPAGNFDNFAGDILITQEGGPPALFVVRWDGGRFVVRKILDRDNPIEHVVFAPIDIPGQ